MRNVFTLLFAFASVVLHTQVVEIDGHLKVNTMVAVRACYCSSSEGSSIEFCWVQDFPGEIQSESPKSMNLWEVRPVRAFHT